MTFPELTFTASDVTKRFTRKPIFTPITFAASHGEIIAICGANGSGKSTLLKIIAGLITPSSGKIEWRSKEKDIPPDELSSHIGFVAPYLELYKDLTAIEHVQFIAELKDLIYTKDEALLLLTDFGLQSDIAASNRFVGQYSSGMKQRVMLAMATVGDPNILLLDEPSATLDEAGIAILFSHIREAATKGKIVIIATNDDREKRLANRTVELQPYSG